MKCWGVHHCSLGVEPEAAGLAVGATVAAAAGVAAGAVVGAAGTVVGVGAGLAHAARRDPAAASPAAPTIDPRNRRRVADALIFCIPVSLCVPITQPRRARSPAPES